MSHDVSSFEASACFDVRSLSAPVVREQIRDARQEFTGQVTVASSVGRRVFVEVLVVFGTFLVGAWLIGSDVLNPPPGWGFPTLFVPVVVSILVVVGVNLAQRRRAWARRARLKSFAADNRIRYRPESNDSFGLGDRWLLRVDAVIVIDQLHGRFPLPFEIGNFRGARYSKSGSSYLRAHGYLKVFVPADSGWFTELPDGWNVESTGRSVILSKRKPWRLDASSTWSEVSRILSVAGRTR